MYDEFLLPSSLKSYNSDQSFSDQCSHISMLLLLLLLLLSMLLKYVAYLPALSRAAFLAIQPDIFIWRYFLKAENADLYGTHYTVYLGFKLNFGKKVRIFSGHFDHFLMSKLYCGAVVKIDSRLK